MSSSKPTGKPERPEHRIAPTLTTIFVRFIFSRASRETSLFGNRRLFVVVVKAESVPPAAATFRGSDRLRFRSVGFRFGCSPQRRWLWSRTTVAGPTGVSAVRGSAANAPASRGSAHSGAAALLTASFARSPCSDRCTSLLWSVRFRTISPSVRGWPPRACARTTGGSRTPCPGRCGRGLAGSRTACGRGFRRRLVFTVWRCCLVGNFRPGSRDGAGLCLRPCHP